MRIAVLGARGKLGGAIVREFSAGHDVCAFDHAALDITDAARVSGELVSVRPDAIINCSGYNAVDAAEDHPVEALRVNAFGVRTLARVATQLGAVLVHYSSDFVFDGEATEPYREDDHPNPQSTYAMSKMLGEWFAADAPGAYVLRLESLFGLGQDKRPIEGSVATIVGALACGGTARAFEDRTVSPTHVIDAARATGQLLDKRAPGGIYHCVNSGRCTWVEFAIEAARLLGIEPRLERIRLEGMKLRAARPRYCAVSNAKLASVGITMPTWQEALASYLAAVRLDSRM